VPQTADIKGRSKMKQQDFPDLLEITESIIAGNPLQKKRIEAFLADRDDEYWKFAEELSRTVNRRFLTTGKDRLEAARSYNKMCMDFLSEQIRFRKTGKYKISDSAVAVNEVYNDLEVMRYYMVGLLISYMFWPNHYELFRFFRHHLPKNDPSTYLEVGLGHGLFTSTMLARYPEISGVGVDVSETSIKTASEVLAAFGVEMSRFEFILGDYLETDFGAKAFDFIIMGEVLEHVNDAVAFMARTKELLAANGRVYISTCANCPALDHVYHFHDAQEIRTLIKEAGFKIVSDLALPAEDVPEECWQEELVTINYCGLLEHAR
jgi:2-polyprenyl-3-methyl-5-hydroxy-6-metoxy-1,4-benzoquinol methylase